MQRFRFRLQRVLDWQRRACRIEEENFRQCLAAIAETDEKRARLAAEKTAIEREFINQKALIPADFQALVEYRKKFAAARQALDREREERIKTAAAQRDKLVAARRRMRVIERLRERALQEYTQAADRESENFSHEAYLATWAARK